MLVRDFWEEHSSYEVVSFDLTGAVPPFTESLKTVGWVFAPPATAVPSTVLLCFPGASYTKAYYHLEVPFDDPDAYSLARALARRGIVVVCLDHLGVGDSSTPDGTLLTLERIAAANAVVTRQIRERLAAGTLSRDVPPLLCPRLIGVGHSMGACAVVTQQAAHRSFDALALLGSTNGPLSAPPGTENGETVFPRPNRPDYLELDRGAYHPLWYRDVPEVVVEVDECCASDVPAGVVMALQQPEVMLSKVATYPASRDITLLQLATGGHCHNFSPSRQVLWRRLALWCQAQGGEEEHLVADEMRNC